MTCGPGHYIGNEEGELLQSMVDHALQAHSRAATPRKDCETCRLQVQHDDAEIAACVDALEGLHGPIRTEEED